MSTSTADLQYLAAHPGAGGTFRLNIDGGIGNVQGNNKTLVLVGKIPRNYSYEYEYSPIARSRELWQWGPPLFKILIGNPS